MDAENIVVGIEKVCPKDGDIILIKINTQNRDVNYRHLENLMNILSKKDVCKGKLILAIDSDMTMESISEETMNKYGWFRGYAEQL